MHLTASDVISCFRFYEPVTFAPNIVPICLPQGEDDYLNRTAWVTGWGRLYESEYNRKHSPVSASLRGS